MSEHENTEKKSGGKVKNFFQRVFVHNIGAKIFALVFSAVLWALAAGLAPGLFDKPDKSGEAESGDAPAVERVADL